jgi:serine/threonine-protein kinase
MIGERLGKWVIYKELGRGGMGRVYLAQEEIGGRQAAIKILSAELAQDAGFLQRFQLEIETLSQLDHPNIVRFYESGLENGHYFYAMEYVEGQSLEDALAEKVRLGWQLVLDAAIQTAAALRHVHDHGVIHRDLKPSNLLRTPAGVIKLTDFGIAKVFAATHLTATGGVVGTAEFLSPEQAAGKPVTKRSDLYSLGVVLYTLLTGRALFEGESVLDLLHKHRYAQFDRPQRLVPEIPYELDEVVCQLLEKDPAKRPPDCHVLGRQLEALRRKLERKGRPTSPSIDTDATVAQNQAAGVREDAVPGTATLMSRLMREELDRQNRGGPIAQLFNRVWVVLPLLLLCLGIIVWTFWPSSASTLYERGAELMKSDNPADWDRAWKEYFEPLNERHPDHPYQKEVEEFRKRIEKARQEREAPPAVSEVQRLYQRGKRLMEEGQLKEAKQVWDDLVLVFDGIDSARPWLKQAREGLIQLKALQAPQTRLAEVRVALKQITELHQQGKIAEAHSRLEALQRLYQNDPAVLEEVQKVADGFKK